MNDWKLIYCDDKATIYKKEIDEYIFKLEVIRKGPFYVNFYKVNTKGRVQPLLLNVTDLNDILIEENKE